MDAARMNWRMAFANRMGPPSTRCLFAVLTALMAMAILAESDSELPKTEIQGETETTQVIESRLQIEVDSILDPTKTQPSDLVLVRVFGTVVLLFGRTHSRALMDEVVATVAPIVTGDPSLKYLRNRIRVQAVKRSNKMGEFLFRSQNRASNASLKSRAMTALTREESLPLSQFKLVTEPTKRGTIYLMGIATHHDADRAVSAIQTAGGVKRIVMVIDYLD